MSHTPGPWRWLNENVLMADHGSRRAIITVGSHNRTPSLRTCKEDGLLHPFDPKSPNARLIAAAPELLDAAKDAQCVCSVKERLSGHLVGCWMPALNEAIAKAVGE